ncbi:MAG: hypothetical protein ACOYL8_04170 [Patescibacteria group bacterium]
MNFENLKGITTNIETENKYEKEELLFEKIEQISLVYAGKKFQEEKKNNEDYKFSEAVKEFSPIENIILRPIFKLDEFNFKKHQEKIDLFLENFYKEIDSIFELNSSDPTSILTLISLKKNSIKSYLEVENFKVHERNVEERGTKIIDFNKIHNIEMAANKKYQDLENYGYSKSDRFVEVHMENFFKTDEKNFGSELVKKDLGVVAEYIIDKEPEAAAVIGCSWLLSTPIANRLGFKDIEDKKMKQNDFSTWLQFIDKNGQIDQKRFNEFLKTGEIPYKSVKAYIPTEEFLKRYLPENRRGKIDLKELNEDRKFYWDKMQEELLLRRREWDDVIKNKGSFNNFINNKALNDLLNYLSPNEKEEYLIFFKTVYEKGIVWEEIYNYKSDTIKKIDEKIEKIRRDDLYKNKEVIID